LDRAVERANAFDKGSGWRRFLPGLSRRAHDNRDRRTRAEYARVGEAYVVGPAREVLSAYAAARAALADI
jgi:hypothetical protein